MPAPSPSITASVGATSGTAVTPAPGVRSIIPPASAISALMRVSSIAATDPKTSVRTITATAIPISSPTGAVCCSARSTTGQRVAHRGDPGDVRDLAPGLGDRLRPVAVADGALLSVEDDCGALVRG